MAIIEIALGVAALYCAGMWLWLCAVTLRRRSSLPYEVQLEIERHTFHLGLCFILAAGFLGLLLE